MSGSGQPEQFTMSSLDPAEQSKQPELPGASLSQALATRPKVDMTLRTIDGYTPASAVAKMRDLPPEERERFWFRVYKQLLQEAKDKDEWLAEWLENMGDYPALGLTAEQIETVSKMDVGTRLKEVRKRISDGETRRKGVMTRLGGMEGARAQLLMAYFRECYDSTTKALWTSLSAALTAFGTPRLFVLAVNTAMLARLGRRNASHIPEFVLEDSYVLNSYVKSRKAGEEWGCLVQFEASLMKALHLQFHGSGLLMIKGGNNHLSKGDLVKTFPEFPDEGEEALIAIPVIFEDQGESDLEEEELNPDPEYEPGRKRRKTSGSAKKGEKPLEEAENIEAPDDLPLGPQGEQPPPESPLGVDSDKYTGSKPGEPGTSEAVEPTEGELVPSARTEATVSTIMENLRNLPDPPEVEPPAPEPWPVKDSTLEPETEDFPLPTVGYPDRLMQEPPVQPSQAQGGKRKGDERDVSPEPPSKKTKTAETSNPCPEAETCEMSVEWKDDLKNWVEITEEERGKVVQDVPGKYDESAPYPCMHHIRQLEECFSLKHQETREKFALLFGKIKEHYTAELDLKRQFKVSSIWINSEFQPFVEKSSRVQRHLKRAKNYEKYVPPPLVLDRSPPSGNMFYAGEFHGTSEGLTFYMKSPLFYWRNLNAGEILGCFIEEIEMLRDRLRDDKASNGRLLNSLHSLAAQFLTIDPFVWRCFVQLMKTKELVPYPLPARYYPAGVVSSIFYEGDRHEQTYLGEYVLSGEDVEVKYMLPSEDLAKFVKKLSRHNCVDFSKDAESLRVLGSYLEGKAHKVRTIKVPAQSMIFYPTGTLIWHEFTLNKPWISIPISLVKVTMKGNVPDCAGTSRESLFQAHTRRMGPISARFDFNELHIKHSNWDPEVRDSGGLFDYLRCRKDFEHPAVQEDMKAWAKFDFNGGGAKSATSKYTSWLNQIAKGTTAEFERWMNMEIKAYGPDKSFFHKGVGTKAPLAAEFIEISDDEDDSVFTLPIKQENASSSFTPVNRTARQPIDDPMEEDRPESSEAVLPPGIGTYALPITKQAEGFETEEFEADEGMDE
jgi:hypothetical protein